MNEDKLRPHMFAEALGSDKENAFLKLTTEIMKAGAISSKEKTLIALACAVAVNCQYCIGAHKSHALMAGATKEEILEAASIGALVRLGSGFTYASYLLDDDFDRPSAANENQS